MYSQKQGRIDTNHRQGSVMTLLIEKKRNCKKIHVQRKFKEN